MSLVLESCSKAEACTSLGGSEKLLIELRERLQDWIKLQPHLPQDVPEQMLEHFILATKMSLEIAKKKLDMFYTMRRFVPELFANRDPRGSDLSYISKVTQVVYLPKLTPQKYRVCIFRFSPDDSSKFDAFECFKYALMIEEILMNETQSLGNIYVFDHSTITLGVIAKFTPTVIKKSEITITEAYAKRIKGIHLINPASLTDMIVTVGKKVLKPKLASRIHTHSKENYESFYEHVPKSILPKDYGGDEPSLDHLAELWRLKVDERRDWFLEQERILVDERLRPGPTVNGDDLFGFSGSFRKLDVD